MHRTVWIVVVSMLLLTACGGEQPAVGGTAAPSVAESAPAVLLPTTKPTAAPNPAPPAIPTTSSGQIFVPVVPGGETAPLPTATAAAAAPSPEPSPEPEYPVYTGPPLNRDNIGIQIYLHRVDMRDLIRHLIALDVGWVKTQVSWKLHEPRPGEYSEELFGELDQLVAAAANHNIKLLLSVSKAPEWSRPITEEDGPPSDYGRFEEFMGYLAARYQGRVAAYELWNEPNLRREWNGAPLDPAQLVELTRRGAAAVRAVDPAVLIISAPPATTGINDGVNAIDDRVYFGGMLAAGMAGIVDGFGVHPYGWANPPDARVGDATQVSTSHNNHPSFFFMDTMLDYQTMLEAAGVVDKQLWVTEFGWATFENVVTLDGLPAAVPAGVEYISEVSEWKQAVYTLRAYELAHSWPWTGPMFLWNLNFTAALGPEFPEVGYSLLRFDESRRPTYRALEFRNR